MIFDVSERVKVIECYHLKNGIKERREIMSGIAIGLLSSWVIFFYSHNMYVLQR